jgi:signal transduction histidine kinase/CheY-like chemotaxis protein
MTPLALADLRRTFRRTRLAVRLAVLTAALAGLVVCGTFVALSVQVRASTRQLISEELSRSQRTLAELQHENRRRLVLTAALLADSPNLRSAIATYRVERQANRVVRADLSATVQRELDRLGSDLNAGTVLATDEDGRVFAGYVRSGGALAPGYDLSRLPAVRHALDPALVTDRGEPYLAGLELDGRYFTVGVAPLILDGYTIGTLVFGQEVDSTLVETLRTAFDGDVVASAGQHVIAATLAATTPRLLDTLTTGHTIGIGDQEYVAAVLPMGRTQRGTALRLTLLQPLTPAVRTLTARLRRDFVLYGALTVLLAALGAAMLSRSLLQPLRAFIATLRSGTSDGRIDQPFDASEASQEIRVLNDSFTQLMQALGRERSQLERRGTELAAANAVLTDEITQRERAEQALRESEAQLRQSQKLESIGTLAGGIAHDFNNLLTVISGFTQLAMGRLGAGHDVEPDLKEVKEAADRASALTRQLLAFSRKQVLQPRVLDLAATVGEMQEMLRRLIGSHIGLRVMHDGRPARVKADPSQLEQVVMNLVVNARDAMPDGGAIVVSTGCEHDASTGWRVVLRVQDTGTGMSPAVRDRIFEPFYTTKEPGKGTGLGLATVYGVVTQSGGTVAVESVVGRGTTFTVSFPPATEITLPKVDADDTAPSVSGTETVLIAEDDDAIRSLAEQALRSCGFTVASAPGGVEALTLARTMPRLDVLLTDVMMPQLGGQQLAERLTATNPGLCVIYMTGWVDESIARLELSTDVALVRKPFTARSLARAVRSAIDQRTDATPPRGVLR